MLEIKEVKIDKEIVLKFLGYKNRKVPKYINKVIDEEIESINSIIDINIFINEMKTSNHKFEGKYIEECFSKTHKSYAILYSIGNEIENKIKYHINNNDMTRGMVLDKVGIVALDYINEEIKKYMEAKNKGFNISFEIYPGDRNFEVSNQKYIYDYVKNDYITINDYGQMTPIKSVAMILCIGKCKNSKSRCEQCLNKCI